MGKIAIKTLKILESGSIEEKESALDKCASYMQFLSTEDQLYFLNQNPERYFMHCDEDIREFLLDAFPDYFVAFISDELKREWCESERLDPGYLEKTLEPLPLKQELLSSMIMAYAQYANLDKEIRDDYPNDFEGVYGREF